MEVARFQPSGGGRASSAVWRKDPPFRVQQLGGRRTGAQGRLSHMREPAPPRHSASAPPSPRIVVQEELGLDEGFPMVEARPDSINDETLYDEAESKKREADDRRSFVQRTIREGGRSVWATLARASENLTNAMGSVREARDDLSAGLCTDGGLGAWASWMLVGMLLAASAVATCLVSAFPASDLAVFGVMALVVATVAVLPYGTHGFAGWSSFDTWPAAVVVCAWNAYGMAIAAHWESARSEAVDWESDGGYSPVLGVLAVCCVAAMHSRLVYASRARTRAVAVAYAAFVVASPSADSVTPAMGTWLALLKVSVFFAIYVTCSFALVSSDARSRSSTNKMVKKEPPLVTTANDGYASRDRLLVQASWVLFTWRFLLVLVVAQLVVYVVHIVANLIEASAGTASSPRTPQQKQKQQQREDEHDIEEGHTMAMGEEPSLPPLRRYHHPDHHRSTETALVVVSSGPVRSASPYTTRTPSRASVPTRQPLPTARHQPTGRRFASGPQQRTEGTARVTPLPRTTTTTTQPRPAPPALSYHTPFYLIPKNENESTIDTKEEEDEQIPPLPPPRDDEGASSLVEVSHTGDEENNEILDVSIPLANPMTTETKRRETPAPRPRRGIFVPFVGREPGANTKS